MWFRKALSLSGIPAFSSPRGLFSNKYLLYNLCKCLAPRADGLTKCSLLQTVFKELHQRRPPWLCSLLRREAAEDVCQWDKDTATQLAGTAGMSPSIPSPGSWGWGLEPFAITRTTSLAGQKAAWLKKKKKEKPISLQNCQVFPKYCIPLTCPSAYWRSCPLPTSILVN